MQRLESWKEVAGYLNRHVTTVRRWEKHEGLPVHRHLHQKLGSIYAYTNELDAWFEGRRRDEGVPDTCPSDDGTRSERVLPPPIVAELPPAPAAVGRQHETQLLQEAWETACRGQQQVLLISGEPGIGKTRLVLEFAREIAKRATVLVGGCDRDALVPFAPFVAMLQWVARATPVKVLHARLADIEGSRELIQIAPQIATRVRLAESPVAANAEGHRYRMFEAFSQLLVATSRRGPVLVVVEDVHWADRGSALLLRHLVRSTVGAAICIVVTCRENEADCANDTREILDDAWREQAVVRMTLGALSEDHVRELARMRIGQEPPYWLIAQLLRRTEGNPLFVTEMLQHLHETGALARIVDGDATPAPDGVVPEGLRELIGRRLARLSEVTQRLLTVASVIGREFRLDVIEALVHLDEEAVLDSMDEALVARIIVEEAGAPGNFAFAHTLIRETLYSRMTAARRVRLHHRIATALERVPSPPLGELAYHFGQAAVHKGAEKAVHYAIRAGDQAAAALAPEEAARYYEMALRALDQLPRGPDDDSARVDLQIKRGRSYFGAGQWARARNAYDAALSLLNPDERATRCELLVSLAEAAFWLMDVPALRAYAGEARVIAEEAGRDDLAADALAWIASAKVADGDVLGGIETDREALARAGGIRSFGLARVPLTLYWAGRLREAADHASDAVARARVSDDPAFLLYALQHLGLSLSGAGRYDEALRTFDEARTFGRRCGALPLLARATSMSVAPLISLGDLEGAMTRALEAREIAHRVAFEPPFVSAGIDLLLIFARSQDPGRAETLLEETACAVRKASGWHAWKWSIRLWQARAELAHARGAWKEAIHAATQVVDQSRARHRLKYAALGLATRARARKRTGSREASVDAFAAVEVARRLSDPAVLLECLAQLLEIDGTDVLREEAHQTAASILTALSNEPLRAAFLARWAPLLLIAH